MSKPPLLVNKLTSGKQKVIGEKSSKNLAPGNHNSWVRFKRIDCPFSLGLFVCTICMRSGWDLRYHFCPIGKAHEQDREDLP